MSDRKAIRKRFEEYILTRTGDHPSVLPVVIDEAVQIRFELVDRETRMRSGWSPLFEEDALDGPERVLIDEEISVCLEELGYPGDLADDVPPDRAPPGSPSDETQPPGLRGAASDCQIRSGCHPWSSCGWYWLPPRVRYGSSR